MSLVILGVLLLGGLGAAWAAPRARAAVAHFVGFLFVYAGERLLAGDDSAATVSMAGTAVILAGLLLRYLDMNRAEGSTADAHRAALVGQLAALGGLFLYALSLDSAVAAVGLSAEAAPRWVVSWQVLAPILFLLGSLPMLMIDVMLGNHPKAVPPGARQHAVQSGLGLALAIALVFPVNYLASEHDAEWDFSYFRVTRPGSSTQALVRGLDKPAEILMFYPSNSEVKEKLLPYFRELEGMSEGKLTVRVVDQPMEPKLSEELGVRDNGYVVIRQERAAAEGETEAKTANEKFRIDPEMKKAKKDLRKLDETFQKSMLKLAKGKRVAYLLTGHGEAGPRDENPLFKLGEFKTLLRAQNYDVNDFGLDQGSTQAVPEDAALVIVAAPQKALMPEEIAVLKRYVDAGGHLLIYADPSRDRMPELLGHLGLAAGEHPLAHASKIVPVTGGALDRYHLFSQRFGTHASVSTLSKYATKAAVVMLSTVGLTETGAGTAPAPAKLTALIRSYEDTWEDVNKDAQQGADEPGKVHVLAYAVQGPDTAPYRAIVIGDVSIASDFVVQRSQGSAQLLLDSSRWLIGDEDLVGETENEEDVQIEHTREDDVAWFYGTIFGVPLLLLAAGAALVRGRSRGAA
jgi:hypothetical protein